MRDPVQTLADGTARLQRGDFAGAMTAVRQILGANPDLGETWANVVWLAEQVGDHEAALQAARPFFLLDPLNPVAAFKIADLMAETGRTDQALIVAETFAEQRPGDPAPQYYVGLFNARFGDTDAAIDRFRKALSFKPDLTPAWEQIAALKTFTAAADPDLAAIETLNTRLASASAEVRAPLLYALGKAYEDLGDADRAFASVAEGARLLGAERPWDGRAFQARVDDILRGFDRAFMDHQFASAVQSDRPLFVVGAPRSGTTLVEQILASVPGVRAGASNLFRLATLPLGDHRPARIEAYTAAAAAAGQSDIWTGFGANYLAFMDERFGFEGRMVDRTPNQILFLGSVHLALPKAPMVWVKRAAHDVAWSVFRTRFQRGQDWSWSLADIGRYLAVADRLHAHWHGLLGDALRTVDYETLVGAPDAQISALLSSLDLEDAPEAHDFHLTDRAIDSAAMVQVRKPMSAERIGAWRAHEARMAPFTRAYEAALR